MQEGRIFENGYRASKEYPEYIDHWFYFPSKADAEQAAERLLKRGWLTKIVETGDLDWLLVATQPATGDEDTGPIFEELTAFAVQFNGIYDGYERPLSDNEFMN
jgi:hypothetical protein